MRIVRIVAPDDFQVAVKDVLQKVKKEKKKTRQRRMPARIQRKYPPVVHLRLGVGLAEVDQVLVERVPLPLRELRVRHAGAACGMGAKEAQRGESQVQHGGG